MIGARKAISRGTATPAPLALHSDVATWQSQVIAAGGSISDPVLQATNALVLWAYANGFRDTVGTNHRIRFWVPFCTNDFNGILIPIWHPVANGVCVNNGFVFGDYNRFFGLQGNGAKYLMSGVTTAASVTDSSGYLAADIASENQGNFAAIGVEVGSTGVTSALTPWYSNGIAYFQHPNYPTNEVNVTTGTSIGFLQGLRDGNNISIIRNTTVLVNGTNTPAANLPSMEFALFGLNQTGVGITGITTGRYLGFLMGTGLTQAQVLSWSAQYLAWKAIVRA